MHFPDRLPVAHHPPWIDVDDRGTAAKFACDLTDELGQKTLPTFLLLIQDTNLLLKGFHELQNVKLPPGLKQIQEASKGSGGGFLGKAFNLTPLGQIVHPVDALNTKLKLLRDGLRFVEGEGHKTEGAMSSAGVEMRGMGDFAGIAPPTCQGWRRL